MIPQPNESTLPAGCHFSTLLTDDVATFTFVADLTTGHAPAEQSHVLAHAMEAVADAFLARHRESHGRDA